MLTLPFLKRQLTKTHFFATKTLSRLRMPVTCFFLRHASTSRKILDMLSTCVAAHPSCGRTGAAPVSPCSHLFQPPPHAPSHPCQQPSAPCTQMFDHGETSLQTKEEESRGGWYLAPSITDLSPLYCQHKHDRQHWDKVEVDFTPCTV